MRKRTSECRTAEIGPGGSPERHRTRAGYRDAVRQSKTIGGWRQKVSRRSDPTYSAPRNANLSNNPHRRNICFFGHERRFAAHQPISALGQKRTSLELFDYLAGALLEMCGHVKTKRASGLQIDRQLESDRSLHVTFAWLLVLKNAINIRRRAPKIIGQVISVGQQASEFSEDGGMD